MTAISNEACRCKTGIAQTFLLVNEEIRICCSAEFQVSRERRHWTTSREQDGTCAVQSHVLRDLSPLSPLCPLSRRNKKSPAHFYSQKLFVLTDLERKLQWKWLLLLCMAVTLEGLECPCYRLHPPEAAFPRCRLVQRATRRAVL